MIVCVNLQKKRIYVRLRFYRRLHINAIIMIKVIRLEMFSLIRITLSKDSLKITYYLFEFFIKSISSVPL